MSKWYMIVATGEDGMGISDWQKDTHEGMEQEMAEQVGYSSWNGWALAVEMELPEGVEPPSLSCWPIDLEETEDEEDSSEQ